MAFTLIPGANAPIELEIPWGSTPPAANKIKVSITALGVNVVKTGEALTPAANKLTVAMTQAESLQFIGRDRGKIQVNWLDSTIRYPTYVAYFFIGEQLYPEVMS